MIPTLVQTVAALLALYRGYYAFGLSLAVWVPVLWTWNPYDVRWEHQVWITCVIPFTVLQAMAAIEAFYRFARWFPFAVRTSIALGLFSVAAMAYMLAAPSESFIGQVIQTAKYERVGSGVFLILAVAFFASIGAEGRNREFRHLCLLTVLAFTWMLQALAPHPGVPPGVTVFRDALESPLRAHNAAWEWWSHVWIWLRTVILVLWIWAVRNGATVANERGTRGRDGPISSRGHYLLLDLRIRRRVYERLWRWASCER